MPVSGRSKSPRGPARWLALLGALAVLAPAVAHAAFSPSPVASPTGGPALGGSSTPAPPVPVDNPRPGSCPPVPANQGGPSGETQTQTGTFPWPPAPAGVSPEDYKAYDHTPATQPPLRPANWSDGGGDWKLTSARSTDPTVANNPQELCGVEGGGVDGGWQVTTGRPDTVIAITDSGIEWCDAGVVDKVYLNRQALPPPENAAGLTETQLARSGARLPDADPYDLDGTGVLNVAQYADDPRVARPFFCAGQGGAYQGISPEDLIRAFGRSGSPWYYGHQGPRGFTEAIAGWNFVDDNNDPFDDVHYDHGTGEASDSTGAADALGKEVGACPNCMVLPVRVGDSFIAAGTDFARGVAFAVDSGASVIQEALGTYDESTSTRQAVSYANDHGVPIIASAADEEAEHHNEPANIPGTIVVNSVTRAPTAGGQPLYHPPGYLFLNGCTNYGANIAVSVESASCSSEATGKAGGVTGLIESAARDLVEKGTLKPYPGVTTVSGAPVALSSTEVRELITMAADDVDFQTAAPPFGPPDNYAVVAPVPTTRYPTQPGYDMYTGYGRLDASRILSWLAAGKVPPEASLSGRSGPLDWFRTYDPTASTLVVPVTAAAVRTPGPLHWTLQYGIGAQPEPDAFYDLSGGTYSGAGALSTSVTLGPAQLSAIAAQLDATAAQAGGTGPDGRPDPDAFSFTLRLVVQDSRGLVGVDRRAEFLRHDPTLLTAAGGDGAVGLRPGGSVDAPPTLAPIGPKGTNALVVATGDGYVHAYVPAHGAGSGFALRDLPGWPVHTVALDSHRGEPAFNSGAVAVPHASIVGGVAVGALGGSASGLDVVATDVTGHVYVWRADGALLWSATTDPMYSSPAARDSHNRLLRGVIGAPALARLENTGQLDVVVSSMDRHVYAWRPDGTPVPGWPVLVVDPSEVAAVDPATHKVTFKPGSNVLQGTKILDTPAVGDLTGKGGGLDDVLVGTNEEYGGQPNVSVANPINWAVGQAPLLTPANSRIYAIGPRGAGSTTAAAPSPQPDAGAFLPGWPVPIGDFEAELLPDVGDGTTASPALADLSGDGRLEAGIITTVGPGYILNPDGTSYLGTGPDGKPRVLSTQPTGPLANSAGYPSLPALGMPVFAPLGTGAPGVSMIAPAASVGKALDAALPDQQQPNDNQLDAWSTGTGHFQAAFPQVMNDLQFIVQPIVADVGGDAAGPYVVEGSATYDIRAVNGLGQEAPGFPKFTGGWMVNSPSFGPLGALADQVLAAGTREGDLLVWSTSTTACAPSGPWPREHHDLWNTGNLSTAGAAAPSAACPAGAGSSALTPPSLGAATGPLPLPVAPPGAPAPVTPPALPAPPVPSARMTARG